MNIYGSRRKRDRYSRLKALWGERRKGRKSQTKTQKRVRPGHKLKISLGTPQMKIFGGTASRKSNKQGRILFVIFGSIRIR